MCSSNSVKNVRYFMNMLTYTHTHAMYCNEDTTHSTLLNAKRQACEINANAYLISHSMEKNCLCKKRRKISKSKQTMESTLACFLMI